jgi:hypothetical protein
LSGQTIEDDCVRTRDAGPVDILTLGSGWTWSFLGPAAGEQGLRKAFTTRDGRNGSIKFTFDPESDETSAFEALPDARTIVIIFPLYSAEAARRLVNGYIGTRSEQLSGRRTYDEKMNIRSLDSARTRFILLGSTGIWKSSGPTVQFGPVHPFEPDVCIKQMPDPVVDGEKKHRRPTSPWIDRHAPIDPVPRAVAEDALLAFNTAKDAVPTSVLCLSGLWGHGRSPRRYVGALAPDKERLSRLTSVHLVHGTDVARAILAMHEQWDKAAAQRWLLTNERVYDLWDLISQWGNAGEAGRGHFPQGPQPSWIQELIAESNQNQASATVIRSLPRSVEQLGFAMDGSDFWNTFKLYPKVPWVD